MVWGLFQGGIYFVEFEPDSAGNAFHAQYKMQAHVKLDCDYAPNIQEVHVHLPPVWYLKMYFSPQCLKI